MAPQRDAAGNREETKGPRGTWAYDLRETYDDLDRPVRSEDALGNVTTRAFDGAGNKMCEKRPLGGSPMAHGGAAGLTAVALAALVCAGDHLTSYAYDEESKLTAVTDARGGVSSFVYDRDRNLLAKQDARGSLTTYRRCRSTRGRRTRWRGGGRLGLRPRRERDPQVPE